MTNEYEIYKVFKDDIFGDKIVHLNPYLSNIRNNENFLEDYFIREIKELKDKINCYEDKLNTLNCKIDKVVDSLAWFIPFRKKRDEFRNKFNDNFIWGGYQEYWTHDENCDNVIPKNWGEFPEGFNVIDFLREITKELDFKRVLDFGCGYGRLSKAFDSDKYIGVDLNLKALKVARKNNPQYRYEDIFINSKNYPDSDLVNAFGVFLHLNDEDLEEALIKLSKYNNIRNNGERMETRRFTSRIL